MTDRRKGQTKDAGCPIEPGMTDRRSMIFHCHKIGWLQQKEKSPVESQKQDGAFCWMLET